MAWWVIFFLAISASIAGAAYQGDLNALWAEWASYDYGEDVLALYPYETCFRRASKMYHIPPALLLAVAKGESDFNPKAESFANCYGVMQIQWPETAKDLGFRKKEELYDACQNIMAGARYLRWLLNMHDENIHLALAAYNYGPGRIHKGIGLYQVPRGAKWYSGYIYHHMKTVLARRGPVGPGEQPSRYRAGDCKLPILTFNRLFRAEGFIEAVEKRDPRIRLDWFRTPKGDYSIVMLCRDAQEERDSTTRLREIGFTVKEEDRFGECVQ